MRARLPVVDSLAEVTLWDASFHCGRAWMDKNLRLNDIVTVGTHNSYKMAIPDKIMALIRMTSVRR